MPEITTLLAAFFIGLMGAGHCLGMCGGIVAALSFSLPARHANKKWLFLLAFSIGRIASYSFIGLAAGLVGWTLFSLSSFPIARIIAGGLLILLGLYHGEWWRGLAYIEKVGARVWRWVKPIADTFIPINTLPQAVVVGALWGWLPCGLIYSALGFAAANADGSPVVGAYIMGAFGLGTLPAIIGGGLASQVLGDFFNRRGVKLFFSLGYILFGCAVICVALYHWGIGGHSHHH